MRAKPRRQYNCATGAVCILAQPGHITAKSTVIRSAPACSRNSTNRSSSRPIGR
jgi:hypothetical protein